VVYKKLVRITIILVILISIILLYKFFSPEDSIFFPKCLFLELTGYQCPGCGSQRAVHSLLNLNIIQALRENALLVISIPYLILGILLDLIPNPTLKQLKWRNILFGRKAIYIVLTIILAFWVGRNVV